MCIEGRNKEEKMFICRHECVFQKAYRVCCIKEILITDQTFKDFEDFKNSCVGKWMDSNGWIKGYEWIKDINGDHYFYKCEIINKSIFFKITKIRDTVKHNLSYDHFEYIRYSDGSFTPTGMSVREGFSKENLQFQLHRGWLIPVRLRLIFSDYYRGCDTIL